MPKVSFLITAILSLITISILPSNAQAKSPITCEQDIVTSVEFPADINYGEKFDVKVNFKNVADITGEYEIYTAQDNIHYGRVPLTDNDVKNGRTSLTFTLNKSPKLMHSLGKQYQLNLKKASPLVNEHDICSNLGTLTLHGIYINPIGVIDPKTAYNFKATVKVGTLTQEIESSTNCNASVAPIFASIVGYQSKCTIKTPLPLPPEDPPYTFSVENIQQLTSDGKTNNSVQAELVVAEQDMKPPYAIKDGESTYSLAYQWAQTKQLGEVTITTDPEKTNNLDAQNIRAAITLKKPLAENYKIRLSEPGKGQQDTTIQCLQNQNCEVLGFSPLNKIEVSPGIDGGTYIVSFTIEKDYLKPGSSNTLAVLTENQELASKSIHINSTDVCSFDLQVDKEKFSSFTEAKNQSIKVSLVDNESNKKLFTGGNYYVALQNMNGSKNSKLCNFSSDCSISIDMKKIKDPNFRDQNTETPYTLKFQHEDDDKKLCGLKTIIIQGNPDTGKKQEKVVGCAPGDKNCTSSAGISCNINNGNLTKVVSSKDPATDKEIITYKDTKTDTVVSGEDLGVYTAIGCIPTNPIKLIESLLKLATGIGGGIALLLAIYGAFQMITSAGNPDGVKKGSEQMTAAIIGLLFIIFSVMLLKVIGVDILQIPGFQ